MINYECLRIFLFMAFVAVVGIIGVEYLNKRIIRSMQTTINTMYEYIGIKDETIELLSVRLKEKEDEIKNNRDKGR